jgi:phosphoglycolate phosphatase-like HAD superfamily hydrolase
MRALLWDIDGTLTKSAGAGTRALAGALHARPRSSEHLRGMRLDGMTDRAIVRILLAAEHGDPVLPVEERARAVTDAAIDEVLEKYLVALASECAKKSYYAQPGVTELVPRLSRRGELLLGLCTGNLIRGAELKLTATGLWSEFRFGGYGSDAEPRPDIVRVAWSRARALGATEALVIGDTPRDILAAHEAGLPACGVATGRFSVHELAENGADCVIENFGDVARAEALLTGPLRARPPSR